MSFPMVLKNGDRNLLRGYNPLNIIDCRTRKVVKFPRGVRYLALSYIWGSENSDESSTPSHDMLYGSIPTTISDTMEVTVHLGLQFFWVDRYCNQSA
jgi:hypothetical protein